jgi:parallel beta-helix repeat protein
MPSLSKVLSLILVLVFLTSSVALQFATVKAQHKTIIVPDDYPNIQSAIDYANAGDTVFVKNGLYSESIVIDKAVSVIGESTEKTIINGTGAVVTINSINVVLDGFTIVCWNKWAEHFHGRVVYNEAFRMYRGIDMKGCNCTVINNIIVNARDGIYQQSQINNNLSNNIILNSGNGISIDYSSNTAICGNIIANAETAIEVSSSSSNIILNNSIINQTFAGVMLLHSMNNTVQANNISHCQYGVYIDESSNNKIALNNIWDSYGISVVPDTLSNSVSSNVIIGPSSNSTLSLPNVAVPEINIDKLTTLIPSSNVRNVILPFSVLFLIFLVVIVSILLHRRHRRTKL